MFPCLPYFHASMLARSLGGAEQGRLTSPPTLTTTLHSRSTTTPRRRGSFVRGAGHHPNGHEVCVASLLAHTTPCCCNCTGPWAMPQPRHVCVCARLHGCEGSKVQGFKGAVRHARLSVFLSADAKLIRPLLCSSQGAGTSDVVRIDLISVLCGVVFCGAGSWLSRRGTRS